MENITSRWVKWGAFLALRCHCHYPTCFFYSQPTWVSVLCLLGRAPTGCIKVHSISSGWNCRRRSRHQPSRALHRQFYYRRHCRAALATSSLVGFNSQFGPVSQPQVSSAVIQVWCMLNTTYLTGYILKSNNFTEALWWYSSSACPLDKGEVVENGGGQVYGAP